MIDCRGRGSHTAQIMKWLHPPSLATPRVLVSRDRSQPTRLFLPRQLDLKQICFC